MRALKYQVQIGKNRKLVLQMPKAMVEGPAEVIVLVPEERAPTQPAMLAEYLQELAAKPRHTRSKQQIDRDVERERRSWD